MKNLRCIELYRLSKYLLCLLSVATLLQLTSCSEDSVSKQPLPIASHYDSTDFTPNSAFELSLRTALQSFVTEIRKGRTTENKLDASTLNNLYQTVGTASTSYYQQQVATMIAEVAKASGGSYNPRLSPTENGEGGVFGGYLFDENGIEMEQLIEKGSFVSALYNHALGLMNQPMSAANTDKILRTFGAHPAFVNTDNAANANRDIYTAAYTARRDKNDGTGFYSQIKSHFIKAQSAAKAGNSYQEEYNQAMADICLTWEKALMATVINYCYAAKSTFAKTNPTDAELASALHAYSECIGFLHGWRSISRKKISDAQIDELLALLLAPHNAPATSYRFVQDAFTTVGNFDTAVSKLATIYAFSTQDLEDFKQNWVNVQQRK